MAEASDHPKSKIQAAEEAVQLALASRWVEALAANDELVERFGLDEETSNRRGKALLELARLDKALAAYQATLELNPANPIAIRQAAKVKELRQAKGQVGTASAALDVNVFTEEPGKTAITRLIPVEGVDPAAIVAGDPVEVAVGEDTVTVRTLRGVDLGGVEPRLAQRIAKLSRGGNRYTGAVTHVDDTGAQVIFREVYQAPELAGTVSFPVRKGRESEYRAYVKETLVSRDHEPPIGVEDEDAVVEPVVPARDQLEEGFSEFDDGEEEEDPPEEADEDARPEDEY
ncbi:MAG: hypothetical protein ACREOD_04500 [Candidatus Dormibacteria bacterium]